MGTSAICTENQLAMSPLGPNHFARLLCHKVFRVSGDHDLVIQSYRKAFNDVIGTANILRFKSLAWEDKDVDTLADTLLDCACLRSLALGENHIANEGAERLAQVF